MSKFFQIKGVLQTRIWSGDLHREQNGVSKPKIANLSVIYKVILHVTYLEIRTLVYKHFHASVKIWDRTISNIECNCHQ